MKAPVDLAPREKWGFRWRCIEAIDSDDGQAPGPRKHEALRVVTRGISRSAQMKFVVMDHGRVIADVSLKSGSTTIGRRKDSDICLDHPAVSGQHAVVWSLDGQTFIRDLVSTNGTSINGSRITKQHLRPGDRVTIGPYDLHYLLETPHMADTSPDQRAPNQCVARHPALFVLSGPASGRRIDLVKPVTHLGKTGQHAGAIVRTADGFRLTGQAGVIRLNGKPLDENGALLNSGDLIDVSEARLQFHVK